MISVSIFSQFCVLRLKIALDLWTVRVTGSGKKVTRLLTVDVDTKNKEGHCCYYEYLWCVHVCVSPHTHTLMFTVFMKVANCA